MLNKQKQKKKIEGHLTTVFADTRLRKTKHPQKRFQNFHQSCVLLHSGFRGGAEGTAAPPFSKRFCTTPTLLTILKIVL